MKISILTLTSGAVEGHRAGCADIARKVAKHESEQPWTEEFSSKYAAFLDYNSDFIAEGTDEADCYQIHWLPCASALPAN